MNILWRFLCWRFYRFVIYREVKTFFFWFYPPVLDYDVSLHDLVELIIIFETSPSSSKTEFGCSSYDRFRIGVSVSFSKTGDSGGSSPETPVSCRNLHFDSVCDSTQYLGRILGGYWPEYPAGPDTPVFLRRRLRRKCPNG